MGMIGRVGAVDIGRILDCTLLGHTAQHWFPDFDRELLRPHEHWLCPAHYDAECGRIPMPVSSWLLRVGKFNVLIDTCVGNDKNRAELAEMHLLDTRYLDRLAGLGIGPEDIDYVLCTHLHVDHVGWNTRLRDGHWVPTFPNAKYVLSRREYLAARDEAARPDVPSFIRNTFADSVYPVVEAGQAELVDDVHELLDGLVLRSAPGHSPGHVRIELESQGARGVFAGDMLHSPLQVPLWQWSSVVCWNRPLAAASRRELLEYCCAENVLLIPGHFQAPHVGRIREAGGTFAIEFGW